jgi:hypothetical protein
MNLQTQHLAEAQEPPEAKAHPPCCFDYSLHFESSGDNERDALLDILIFEGKIELTEKQKLRVGGRRCELTLVIMNGELPLNTRTITNPMPLSTEVSFTRTIGMSEDHSREYARLR